MSRPDISQPDLNLAHSLTLAARPDPVAFVPASTAVLLIDMQRDFLEPGGFGAALGNDVDQLRRCIEPCQRLLAAARRCGIRIIHTREGHRTDLSDLHPEKQRRCPPGRQIGDPGPMGRILVRGETGHDFIAELQPLPGESIIDKPGKGAFYATDLELLLASAGISTLLICGVTTEVCVHTTVREANDRGYRVIVPEDCCASYFPAFHQAGIEMICAQGGIFGSVCTSAALLAVLDQWSAQV